MPIYFVMLAMPRFILVRRFAIASFKLERF
jgi:hypothetical protein